MSIVNFQRQNSNFSRIMLLRTIQTLFETRYEAFYRQCFLFLFSSNDAMLRTASKVYLCTSCRNGRFCAFNKAVNSSYGSSHQRKLFCKAQLQISFTSFYFWQAGSSFPSSVNLNKSGKATAVNHYPTLNFAQK